HLLRDGLLAAGGTDQHEGPGRDARGIAPAPHAPARSARTRDGSPRFVEPRGSANRGEPNLCYSSPSFFRNVSVSVGMLPSPGMVAQRPTRRGPVSIR